MNAKQERAMEKKAAEAEAHEAAAKAEEKARQARAWATYGAEKARGEMLDAMTDEQRAAFLAAERAGAR